MEVKRLNGRQLQQALQLGFIFVDGHKSGGKSDATSVPRKDGGAREQNDDMNGNKKSINSNSVAHTGMVFRNKSSLISERCKPHRHRRGRKKKSISIGKLYSLQPFSDMNLSPLEEAYACAAANVDELDPLMKKKRANLITPEEYQNIVPHMSSTDMLREPCLPRKQKMIVQQLKDDLNTPEVVTYFASLQHISSSSSSL
eukprot:m.10935 g.10935  ORF g.10935 m.10935 type:complete len:200 (+) comp3745_c0_seq1:61-660(+)